MKEGGTAASRYAALKVARSPLNEKFGRMAKQHVSLLLYELYNV
jgi:hypothetical protein